MDVPNISMMMERADTEVFQGVYNPVGRLWCAANILSGPAIRDLRRRWLQSGKLTPMTVSTGGGLNNVRWPAVNTVLSRFAGGQVHPPTQSLAWTDIRNYYSAMRSIDAEIEVPTPNNFNINVSQVLWRYNHPLEPGNPATEYRKIPLVVEISHHAESYHKQSIIPGFQSGWEVELMELETDWINESRKVCTHGCLMWRKASDGQIIPQDEVATYTGPTLCWHAAYGSPCYAPYPAGEPVVPTGRTPGKRRGGRGSGEGKPAKRGRGGGRGSVRV